MARFPPDADRLDPYKSFKFRVKWDDRYVAGVAKVSMLKRAIEAVKHRPGGDPSPSRKVPGRTGHDAITLERGVTHDPEFQRWANMAGSQNAGVGEAPPADHRRDITLEMLDEAGRVTRLYRIHRCWVSEYRALPDLDGNANGIAIAKLKLENEGWELQPGVVEP